ncbi:hypothetical protein P152DRAFT_482137 [Eremomyces bilateralis CBS 781.70]|uniref:Uncharacterized protein n=1 Tax=Eremomyces bilateralis CBS 781.70 TaxID=1392243 RepID=A0A6G1G415_9PEZI|nr:uncharacterized protein P152DRAFT_482137 [Eremomyces bilateralis CBS 781.70]KAF1812660.1 hypothetical protein P152DRAFT_482137 [Eremomyces bilateralis CBS 781.70]
MEQHVEGERSSDYMVAEAEDFVHTMTAHLRASDMDVKFLDHGFDLQDQSAFVGEMYAEALSGHPLKPQLWDSTLEGLANDVADEHAELTATQDNLQAKIRDNPTLVSTAHDIMDRRMQAVGVTQDNSLPKRTSSWASLAARLRHLLHSENEKMKVEDKECFPGADNKQASQFSIKLSAHYTYDGKMDRTRLSSLYYSNNVTLPTFLEALQRNSRNWQTAEDDFPEGYSAKDGDWLWIDPTASRTVRKLKTDGDLQGMIKRTQAVHQQTGNVVLVFHEKYQDHLNRIKNERQELNDRRFYEDEPTDENGVPLYDREFDFIKWCRDHHNDDGTVEKPRDEDYWADIEQYRKRIGLE